MRETCNGGSSRLLRHARFFLGEMEEEKKATGRNGAAVAVGRLGRGAVVGAVRSLGKGSWSDQFSQMDADIPSLSSGSVGSRFVSQTELDVARQRREEQWKAAYAR